MEWNKSLVEDFVLIVLVLSMVHHAGLQGAILKGFRFFCERIFIILFLVVASRHLVEGVDDSAVKRNGREG